MTELIFAGRTAQGLQLLDEDGNQYLLPVDNSLLHEVRAVLQHQSGAVKVRPARIQKLLRSGFTVAEVAAATGYPEEDVERFAPPVEREISYVLERAFAVPVRTSNTAADTGEKFGDIIAARLVALGASEISWAAAQDEQRHWNITVKYTVYGESLHAIWAFDSVKQQLTAVNNSAVELSKQQLEQHLIPRGPQPLAALNEADRQRAADSWHQQHPANYDRDHGQARKEFGGAGAHTAATSSTTQQEAAHHDTARQEAAHLNTASHSSAGNATVTEFPDISAMPLYSEPGYDIEFGEQPHTPSLDETANLLEALRQRRGEREREVFHTAEQAADLGSAAWHQEAPLLPADPHSAELFDTAPYERLSDSLKAHSDQTPNGQTSSLPAPQRDTSEKTVPSRDSERKPDTGAKAKKRGRTAIPSWDEILFGARSDDNK